MQRQQSQTSASSQYQFLDKLGEGSFGYIWKVKSIATGQILACKMVKNSMKKERQLLQREIKILQLLKGKKGFTQLVAFGCDAQNTYFVMHLLGENLEQLRLKYGNFSLKMIMNAAQQMIALLRDLHACNVLHRDIKPENFVMHQDKLHLIDFGLSKLYMHDGKHIEFKENKGMIGTARYASINALKGNEQGRRDDLESVAYLLIYLNLGQVPWMNITCEDRQLKYMKIMKMKEHFKADQLSYNVPVQVIMYLQKVKQLQFDQVPDYEYLINLFKEDSEQVILRQDKIQRKSSQYRTHSLIRLKQVRTPHQISTSRIMSPQNRNNTSRRITFDELSSDGVDITEEFKRKERIKIHNFTIGLKQPMQSCQQSVDTEAIDEECDESHTQRFKVPESLILK